MRRLLAKLLLLVVSLSPATVVLGLADQAPLAFVLLSVLAGSVSATAALAMVGSREASRSSPPEA